MRYYWEEYKNLEELVGLKLKWWQKLFLRFLLKYEKLKASVIKGSSFRNMW